jgi:hypothetical protein
MCSDRYCQTLIKIGVYRQVLAEVSRITFCENPSSEQTYGRTDTAKITGTFLQIFVVKQIASHYNVH